MARRRGNRTPLHLWIVGVVSLLWNAIGAMDYLMTETRNADYIASFTAAQLEYYNNFPSWAVAFWATAVWGGVLGSLLLLLRTRWAVPVFLVSLICLIVTTIYRYGLSNGLEVAGEPFQLAFTAVIFVVAVALYFYSRAMLDRGVLR